MFLTNCFIKENYDTSLRILAWHASCSSGLTKGIRQPHKGREIEMRSYKRVFTTLAIGTVMVFLTFSVPASAGEKERRMPPSETALQARPTDEQGGYEYGHRNTWKHQNVKQSQYGSMGEDARFAKGGGFVDEDGDGVNDLAADHDGDGIPNGQDSDWVKNKEDGTGYQHGKQMTDGGKRCERSHSRGSKGARAAR
jgi:hypothetical protein